MALKHATTSVLEIGYFEHGPEHGWPAVLLHGFPYDVHAYDAVVPLLVAQGARVIVPYLRGFGPTRFLRSDTPRSGQQGALGSDLLGLLDALGIAKAILVGYDWGGRAACVVSALWPERVRGLVSIGGYNILDGRAARTPLPPIDEYKYWYQYYLHGDRGYEGLRRYRRDFCRLLWRLWSPTWSFREDAFEETAASFDNPDFVDVVVHSYRHRFGLVDGDPAYDDIERRLDARPPIAIPTITMDGADDGVALAIGPSVGSSHFLRHRGHWTIAGAGHNLPQENARALADAVARSIVQADRPSADFLR